jgi:GntR family transcriptional regulator
MNIVKADPVETGTQKLLSQKTKLAIINIIQKNAKPGVPYKLPNEGEMSATLGVSRNVLRDSLAALAEMGLITRRRGRGTIANPEVANAKFRIDIDP